MCRFRINQIIFFAIYLSILFVATTPMEYDNDSEDAAIIFSNHSLVRSKRNIESIDKILPFTIAYAMFICNLLDRDSSEEIELPTNVAESESETGTRRKKGICVINIKKLSLQHALIIDPLDHTKFLYPNDKGLIYFKERDPVFLSCADSSNEFNEIPNVRHLTFYCMCEKVFWSTKGLYNFYNLKCKHTPVYSVVDSCVINDSPRKTDISSYSQYDIGFFTDDDFNFLKVMKVIHDNHFKTAMYSKSVISKVLNGKQATPKDIPFNTNYCCKSTAHSMEYIYYPKTQAKSFQAQLKGESLVDFGNRYLQPDRGYYFNRTQLTPPDSQVYGVAATALFTYVNVVPQWVSFKKGNWILTETHVNEMATALGLDLTVITGALYPLRLRDNTFASNPSTLPIFFFAKLRNGQCYEKYYPIPSHLYKIVIDPESNSGAVFVTENNPHITIGQNEYLCKKPILHEKSMILPSWNNQQPDLGLSYMCHVQDFLKRANVVIFERITATDLLYIRRTRFPRIQDILNIRE